jgi:hypothetical protein
MGKHSDEMNFAEFRAGLLALPPGTDGIIGEFAAFLRSGCTELEAKRWVAARIWDFEQPLRDQIVMLFATDALHKAATNPDSR